MWPDAKLSQFSSSAVAERKRQRRKILERERGAAAIPGLRGSAKAASQVISERARRALDDLGWFLDLLRGPEFKAWYEATTRQPVGPWLERVAISHDEYHARGLRDHEETQLEWIERQIRLVVERHPWTNPDLKPLWGEMLANCRCSKARRMLLLKLATPARASKKKIREIYLERARIEKETGVPRDVDHIIPIVSLRVCGLHWEGNLRIIPAAENRSKSNSFYADDSGLDKFSADRKIRSNLTL